MFTDFDYRELHPIPGTVHKFTQEGETLTVFATLDVLADQDDPERYPALFTVWYANSYYGGCSEPYTTVGGSAAKALAEGLANVGSGWVPTN